MPAALLRVATDNSTAMAVKPNAGGSTDAHASATRSSACADGSSAPDKSIRGWAPTTSIPAATLLTANADTASEEKTSAVRTFPANTSSRLRERVRWVIQVL